MESKRKSVLLILSDFFRFHTFLQKKSHSDYHSVIIFSDVLSGKNANIILAAASIDHFSFSAYFAYAKFIENVADALKN